MLASVPLARCTRLPSALQWLQTEERGSLLEQSEPFGLLGLSVPLLERRELLWLLGLSVPAVLPALPSAWVKEAERMWLGLSRRSRAERLCAKPARPSSQDAPRDAHGAGVHGGASVEVGGSARAPSAEEPCSCGGPLCAPCDAVDARSDGLELAWAWAAAARPSDIVSIDPDGTGLSPQLSPPLSPPLLLPLLLPADGLPPLPLRLPLRLPAGLNLPEKEPPPLLPPLRVPAGPSPRPGLWSPPVALPAERLGSRLPEEK